MKAIHSSYVFKQTSSHNLRTKANYHQVTTFNQPVTVLFYLHIKWRQVFLQFLNICRLSEHSKTKQTDNFKQSFNCSVFDSSCGCTCLFLPWQHNMDRFPKAQHSLQQRQVTDITEASYMWKPTTFRWYK